MATHMSDENTQTFDPKEERAKAREDYRLYGVGFLVDGIRVAPERVTVINGTVTGQIEAHFLGIDPKVSQTGRISSSEPNQQYVPGTVSHAMDMARERRGLERAATFGMRYGTSHPYTDYRPKPQPYPDGVLPPGVEPSDFMTSADFSSLEQRIAAAFPEGVQGPKDLLAHQLGDKLPPEEKHRIDRLQWDLVHKMLPDKHGNQSPSKEGE